MKNCTSTLCSALMDVCKRTLHARCFHWLATSAAFTAKVAVWPTVRSKWSWMPTA